MKFKKGALVLPTRSEATHFMLEENPWEDRRVGLGWRETAWPTFRVSSRKRRAAAAPWRRVQVDGGQKDCEARGEQSPAKARLLIKKQVLTFLPPAPPPICPDAAVESQRWRSGVTRREESLECTRRLLVTLIGRDAIAGVPQFPRPLSVSQHISWHAVPVNNCVAVHWLAPRRRAHFNLLAARIDCQAQRIPHKQTPGSLWVVTASRQRRTTVRSHSKKRVKDLIDFFFLDNNWLNVWWAVVSKLVIYLNTYNKTLESNKYEIIWINLNICLQICANLNILNIFGPCKKKIYTLISSLHFIAFITQKKPLLYS